VYFFSVFLSTSTKMTTSSISDSKGMRYKQPMNPYHNSLKCVFHNAGIDKRRGGPSPCLKEKSPPPDGLRFDLQKGER
jgi:hypothetical protein